MIAFIFLKPQPKAMQGQDRLCRNAGYSCDRNWERLGNEGMKFVNIYPHTQIPDPFLRVVVD
jgi:hypothetical protein